MTYQTLIDFPGVPAGETLELDTSQPNSPAYRGTVHTQLWFAQDFVEANAAIDNNPISTGPGTMFEQVF